MHEEYKAFFRLFGNVSRYGCDFSPTEGTPDEFQRPLGISQEDFLAEIYEPRGVESRILESLKTNPNLICLVGPQGAGKSSIAYKIRYDLRSTAPTTFAVFLDMRLEIANNSVKTASNEELESSLRRRLIHEYRERLFPLTRSGDNPRLKLWTFLLDRLSEREKPLHLFAGFTPLQDLAAKLLRRYDEAHKKDVAISFNDWLAKTYASQDDVAALTEKVDAEIDLSHLVYGARFVLGITHQVVWIDNIDALADDLQTEAVHAAKRIFLPVQNYVGMLVAVREENIFRDYDLCDEGAPPQETRILLEMPRGGGDDHAYYPSHDVPVANEHVLRGMVRRRLEATRKYQAHRMRELEAELAKYPADSLDERFLRLRREQSTLSPAITPHRFGQVQVAADRLLQAMNTEKAIYVTNNSLRDYLFMFRDCLADMFREQEDAHGAAPATKYPEWLITTMMLRRARHTSRRYQIGVYDVIAATEEHFRGDTARPGCLLPYLVIATAWNLTLKRQSEENRYGHTPTVTMVERELTKIGYATDEIRATMHALYFRNNSRNNLLEFRCRAVLRSAEDIASEHVVYATYRGKCLVARTGSSFGYLYDCLALLGEPDVDVGTLPLIRDSDDVVDELIPHLCDMAEAHYLTLKNIRDTGALGPGDWLGRYYASFGTPYVATYGRSSASESGRLVAGRRRMLLLEGILNGLLSYIRAGSGHDKLVRLSNAYLGAVNNLTVQATPVPPAFRQLMGVSSRKARAHA